jgi:plastocyanin
MWGTCSALQVYRLRNRASNRLAAIGRETAMKERRLRVFLALTVGLVFVLLPTVPAHAGGGCHDAQTLDVAGTHVDLKGLCFVQTVLRVKLSQPITWTNSDSTQHTITGVGGSWGSYDSILPGESVTYRFTKAGIYPYFCLLHPGMVGAVVVGGGGKPSGTESATTVFPVISSPSPAGSTSAVSRAPATSVSASSPGPWRTVALVTLGLLVAAAAAFAAQRLGLRRSHARARAG